MMWIWIILGLIVVIGVVLFVFFPKKAQAGSPSVASTGGTTAKEPDEPLIKIEPTNIPAQNRAIGRMFYGDSQTSDDAYLQKLLTNARSSS